MVVAHVLVDAEDDAALLAGLDRAARVLERRRQRLLGEDPADPGVAIDDLGDQARLDVRRVGDVDDLDRAVVDQVLPALEGPDPEGLGERRRALRRPRGDPDHLGAGGRVGGQVAFADDPAGADHPDPRRPGEVALAGMAEVTEVDHHRPSSAAICAQSSWTASRS